MKSNVEAPPAGDCTASETLGATVSKMKVNVDPVAVPCEFFARACQVCVPSASVPIVDDSASVFSFKTPSRYTS